MVNHVDQVLIGAGQAMQRDPMPSHTQRARKVVSDESWLTIRSRADARNQLEEDSDANATASSRDP